MRLLVFAFLLCPIIAKADVRLTCDPAIGFVHNCNPLSSMSLRNLLMEQYAQDSPERPFTELSFAPIDGTVGCNLDQRDVPTTGVEVAGAGVWPQTGSAFSRYDQFVVYDIAVLPIGYSARFLREHLSEFWAHRGRVCRAYFLPQSAERLSPLATRHRVVITYSVGHSLFQSGRN
jgi:hypothetical protein